MKNIARTMRSRLKASRASSFMLKPKPYLGSHCWAPTTVTPPQSRKRFQFDLRSADQRTFDREHQRCNTHRLFFLREVNYQIGGAQIQSGH